MCLSMVCAATESVFRHRCTVCGCLGVSCVRRLRRLRTRPVCLHCLFTFCRVFNCSCYASIVPQVHLDCASKQLTHLLCDWTPTTCSYLLIETLVRVLARKRYLVETSVIKPCGRIVTILLITMTVVVVVSRNTSL